MENFQWGMHGDREYMRHRICSLPFTQLLFYGQCQFSTGTNNVGEFNALYYLLNFVVEKNIGQLKVFGDSDMVIQRINDKI